MATSQSSSTSTQQDPIVHKKNEDWTKPKAQTQSTMFNYFGKKTKN